MGEGKLPLPYAVSISRYVIPSAVEGPLNRSTRYASKRGPSTEFILSSVEGLRMTPLFPFVPLDRSIMRSVDR
jgi:hypothetical protein